MRSHWLHRSVQFNVCELWASLTVTLSNRRSRADPDRVNFGHLGSDNSSLFLADGHFGLKHDCEKDLTHQVI